MNEKIYYSAEDIAKMLGVSMGKAYKILREMNKDLTSKGFLTIAGKIPVEYFKGKWYGGAKEVSMLVQMGFSPVEIAKRKNWKRRKQMLQKGINKEGKHNRKCRIKKLQQEM